MSLGGLQQSKYHLYTKRRAVLWLNSPCCLRFSGHASTDGNLKMTMPQKQSYKLHSGSHCFWRNSWATEQSHTLIHCVQSVTGGLSWARWMPPMEHWNHQLGNMDWGMTYMLHTSPFVPLAPHISTNLPRHLTYLLIFLLPPQIQLLPQLHLALCCTYLLPEPHHSWETPSNT